MHWGSWYSFNTASSSCCEFSISIECGGGAGARAQSRAPPCVSHRTYSGPRSACRRSPRGSAPRLPWTAGAPPPARRRARGKAAAGAARRRARGPPAAAAAGCRVWPPRRAPPQPELARGWRGGLLLFLFLVLFHNGLDQEARLRVRVVVIGRRRAEQRLVLLRVQAGLQVRAQPQHVVLGGFHELRVRVGPPPPRTPRRPRRARAHAA